MIVFSSQYERRNHSTKCRRDLKDAALTILDRQRLVVEKQSVGGVIQQDLAARGVLCVEQSYNDHQHLRVYADNSLLCRNSKASTLVLRVTVVNQST